MKMPIEFLYLFLAIIGLLLLWWAVIVLGRKKPLKKASIEFIQTKKELTSRIQITNVNKEKEKEILRDIFFDVMQIEIKLKKHFSPSANIINWKIPFENDTKKGKEKV